jgi:hypothetical protein
LSDWLARLTGFKDMRKTFVVRLGCAALAGSLLTLPALGATFNVATPAQLISAVNSANGSAGPHTINLSTGTYNLSGELPVIAANESITFQGGSANLTDTVLHQTLANTRFVESDLPAGNVNNIGLTFNNLTFDSGQGGDYGGGALLVGGIGSSTTVSNCVFSNNRTSAGANVNAGGAIENSPNGNVTVLGCRFQGNSSAVYGGAIDFLNQTGGSGSLFVSNSVFISNSAAADGGAVKASTDSGTITIVDCNFEGNSTTGSGRGGAITHVQGALTASYNRFFNNTATSHANGDTLWQAAGAGACDATRNWWGANSGPGGTDILASGAVTSSPWLQLRHQPAVTDLGTGATTTLTADLLGLSAGGSLTAVSLAGLPAVPANPATLFHNPVLGTLSAAATQFLHGQATATFNAGSLTGAAQADVSLDNQTVTAAMRLLNSSSQARAISVTTGSVTIQFSGLPTNSYDIQRATDVRGPWATVDTQIASTDGSLTYTDPHPPAPMAYYRLHNH